MSKKGIKFPMYALVMSSLWLCIVTFRDNIIFQCKPYSVILLNMVSKQGERLTELKEVCFDIGYSCDDKSPLISPPPPLPPLIQPVAYLLGGQGGQAAPPDQLQAKKKKNYHG